MAQASVIPAKAGIQGVRFRGLRQTEVLVPRLRGDDGFDSNA